MAQTSTAKNACAAAIWVDNTSGVLTDISGSATSVELGPSVEVGEFRTFASRWKGRIPCGQDLTATLNIVYSTAADEGWAIMSQPPESRPRD